MFKKMDDETYESFWKEFSTKLVSFYGNFCEECFCSVKLGIMEDPTNRTRLAKLLRSATGVH